MLYKTSKKKKPLTAEDRFRLTLIAEADLVKYRRQYNLLSKSKTSHAAVFTLHRQKRVINVLRAEYNEIETDLGVAASAENTAIDSRNAQSLQCLLTTHQNFRCDVKLEKDYLSELDTQIGLVKKKILNLRRQLPNYWEEKAKVARDKHTLEALENKLEGATKRFCLTVSDNRRLRDEIKHLLIERSRFALIWDQLLGNLASARKYMIDLIQVATLAYDQREEWVQKLTILRRRAYGDYISQTLDMTEMQRLIDEGSKLERFLCTKGQKRLMKKLMDKEFQRREELKKEMSALIEKYTQTMEDIREFWVENKTHKIIEKYIYTEYENYTQFKRVLHLNGEIEELSDDVSRLHEIIDEGRLEIQKRQNAEAEEILDLENQLADYTYLADEADAELESMDADLNEILSGLQALFNQMKTHNPFGQLLGSNATINIYNAYMFLKLIERRMNEIMINVSYKEKRKYGSKPSPKHTIRDKHVTYHSFTLEELVTEAPCPLCVEKAMVSDVIESLQKVMNREELTENLELTKQQEFFNELIHNVTGCPLPKARAIVQASFQ